MDKKIKLVVKILLSPLWVPFFLLFGGIILFGNFIGTLLIWLTSDNSWSECWNAETEYM